jgi:uncharacterized oxidoreductase
MPRYSADDLKRFTVEIFKREGVSDEVLEILADHLVTANLVGMDSHGVLRIPQYIEMMRKGTVDGRPFIKIKPDGQYEIVKDNGPTVMANGNWNFGQVTAWRSMNIAIERAKEHGVSTVTSFNTAHIGRLGEYTAFAAERDMVAMLFCNIGRIVAPFGGYERKLGTNPISVGIPTGGDFPFVLDMATCNRAEGKVRDYRIAGKELPGPWIVDKNGHPSVIPEELYDGGAILPFGGEQGYKGFGLAMMIDMLGSMLTGTGFPGYTGHQYGSTGPVIIVLDVARFIGIDEFKAGVDQLITDIKSSKTREGFDEILIPGEPEYRTMKKREKEGIEISQGMMDKLIEVASSLDISPDDFLTDMS